jgi:hypothetical protein
MHDFAKWKTPTYHSRKIGHKKTDAC